MATPRPVSFVSDQSLVSAGIASVNAHGNVLSASGPEPDLVVNALRALFFYFS